MVCMTKHSPIHTASVMMKARFLTIGTSALASIILLLLLSCAVETPTVPPAATEASVPTATTSLATLKPGNETRVSATNTSPIPTQANNPTRAPTATTPSTAILVPTLDPTPQTIFPSTRAILGESSAESDKAVLITFFRATNGESWETSKTWLGHRPIGEWEGVTTDKSGRVTELKLVNLGLTGKIPPELGYLVQLRKLNLGYNLLRGGIPPELGALSNLTELFFYNNRLSGDLPPELGNLAKLQWLNVQETS